MRMREVTPSRRRVVKAGVVRLSGERTLHHVLQAGPAKPFGDVPRAGAGHPPLALRGGIDLPGCGPEDVQHGHASCGDIPHARGDGATRAGYASHLPHALVGVAHEPDHQARECGIELAVGPGQLLGGALADVSAGNPLAAGRDELRRGVDRRDVPGTHARGELSGEPARPTAHVEDPLGRRHARDVGERDS
jgi:hypothetical protein